MRAAGGKETASGFGRNGASRSSSSESSRTSATSPAKTGAAAVAAPAGAGEAAAAVTSALGGVASTYKTSSEWRRSSGTESSRKQGNSPQLWSEWGQQEPVKVVPHLPNQEQQLQQPEGAEAVA